MGKVFRAFEYQMIPRMQVIKRNPDILAPVLLEHKSMLMEPI